MSKMPDFDMADELQDAHEKLDALGVERNAPEDWPIGGGMRYSVQVRIDKLISPEAAAVLALKNEHSHTWRNRHQSYWMMRLMQEVGELASSLANDHEDPPEHELKQIAAIAINWLEYREEARATFAVESVTQPDQFTPPVDNPL